MGVLLPGLSILGVMVLTLLVIRFAIWLFKDV